MRFIHSFVRRRHGKFSTCPVLGLMMTLAIPVFGSPAGPRMEVNLDANWRFILSNPSNAQATNFNDSAWTLLNLPHDWNNLDGQDGGNNYYRGIGWYRTHYLVDGSLTNKQFFLKFDGASLVADVYVNGNLLGEHQGAFAAFVFDMTPYLNVGGDNVIAVEVNNSYNASVPPLGGDFNVDGGIYRDVHLLVTDPVQISPLDYGSPGVYLMPTNVSASSANLQITTLVSNANPSAVALNVISVIADAASNIVMTITNPVAIPGATLSNIVATTVISNPHLWNGIFDPYLYSATVQIWNDTNLLDAVTQPLGFRSFSLDPNLGFFLNGQSYSLHGVSMHEDWLNCGWALTNAQRETNFMLIKEIGATSLRMAHWQHNAETYQLADQNGVAIETEVPLVNAITASTAFSNNAVQQMRELIRQNYNHPSIFFWGIFNEITHQAGPITTNLDSAMAQLVAQEDPTRVSSAASSTPESNGGNNFPDSDPSNWYSYVIGFNKYFGWYTGVSSDFAAWADTMHANYPTRFIGVTEYGAGASIYQHSEDPVPAPPAFGSPHPEEWQNLVHESHWQQMKTRPFIWGTYVWNMFDFAVDYRNEGDHAGRNDKGLVTYDRRVRKDAFYFYKANWTTNPMVYITGHTFTNRLTNNLTAKVYANCDSVELILNGVSQGNRTSTNSIFLWPVTLTPGSNVVQAIGTKGGSNVTDSLLWIAPTTPPSAAIINPTVSRIYLNSTNDTLLLSATASSTAPMSTTWTLVGGVGAVTFGNSNALSTTANFSANGTYNLLFTANNGSTTSVGLTVIVNPNTSGATNGLLAWWKMDATGGSTAVDSSGNSRTATVNGAIFTSGYLSNALSFNGTGNNASFSSPDTAQITVAAWVRADSQGNSAYPRILDTAGYRLFFRFDNQGTNGFDFATYSTVNGDWFSGANTIRAGAWYHVAASYDRGSFANVPSLYLNGAKVSPVTLASPSGTQPAYTGTGYIGNNSALSRAWNGLIDDLRIYNRLLTDTEVQTLAALPPANFNLAPIVSAGGNQLIFLPAAASLTGTVADDSKPNPPGMVTTFWSQINGPGSVVFANSNAPVTTASFSAPGAYSLQLAANDGQVSTVANVTVTATTPPTLGFQLLSGALQLSWPTNIGNWQLQFQTNSTFIGLTTNWINLPGSVTNPFVIPLDDGPMTEFYRLVLMD